jgi:hypothetical protein
VQVEARDAGFRDLYRWLNHRGELVVAADRREQLVVVRMSVVAEIAKGAAK